MTTIIALPFLFVFIVLCALFVYFLYRRAWKIPAPNEALIIVGKAKGASASVVAQEKISDGGAAEAIQEDRLEGLDFRIATSATWVNPMTSRTSRLSLKSRSTNFEAQAHDKDKIAVTVRGVLLYKVGDNYDAMARAARRFLDIDEHEMNKYIENLVTGQARALVGSMSIEELITNRQALIDQVRTATYEDMAKLGLQIDSLSIQEITDNNNYIENLGRPQAEQVARDASIAVDQARREKEKAKQDADVSIAEMRRDTEVKAAGFKAEQDKAVEEASQAGPLAKATAQRSVVEKETEVAEMQVRMAAKRYEAEVGERAKAERFRIEQEAEAEANKQTKLGESAASSIRQKGEAEAAAIEAKGLAEAKVTKEKAAALATNGELIVRQLIAENMPQIAESVAKPLGEIDNMVVLDGQEGLTKMVTGAVAAAGSAATQIMSLADAKGRVGGDVARAVSSVREAIADGVEKAEQKVHPDPESDAGFAGGAAPELSTIAPEGYKPAESTVDELSAGRPEIMVESSGLDFGTKSDHGDAWTSLQDVLGHLSKKDVKDLPQLVRDLKGDPKLVAAFNDVAADDEVFEGLLSRLPGGKEGALLGRFLRSYRDKVLDAV